MSDLVDSRWIKHLIRDYRRMTEEKIPFKEIIETLRNKYNHNLPFKYQGNEQKRKPNKAEIEAIIKEFDYFYK